MLYQHRTCREEKGEFLMGTITTGYIKSINLSRWYIVVHADGKDIFVGQKLLRSCGYQLDKLVEKQEIIVSYAEHPPESFRADSIEGIPTGVKLNTLPEGIHSGSITFYDTRRGFGFIAVSGGYQDVYFKTSWYSGELKKGMKVSFEVDSMGVLVQFVEDAAVAA